MSTDTTWIEPGVEVVVIVDGSTVWSATKTTVGTVAKTSFTVVSEPGRRFKKDHPSLTQNWVNRTVVPIADERAQLALYRQSMNDRRRAVSTSYDRWARDSDNALLLDALESAVKKLKLARVQARLAGRTS